MPSATEARDERTKRLARGVAMSALARGFSLVVPVVLIPLTYRSFGPAQYAAWATVLATTSMFLWADLGLGNGLMTKLPAALARDDLAAARHLISAAYSTLAVAAVAMIILLAVSTSFVSWGDVLGLGEASDVNATVLVCFGLLFIQIPLALVQRIQFAVQEVDRSSAYQMIGSLSSLIGAGIAVATDSGYLATVAVIAIGPLAGLLLASVSFYRRHPELVPTWAGPMSRLSRDLLVLGGLFLFVQACSSIAMNLDFLVAARVVSDGEMAEFSATLRIFLVLGAILNVALLPLWPANADALARGDSEWVTTTTRRMSLLGFGLVIAAGVSLTLGHPLIESLLGAGYAADPVLMLGLTTMWAVVALTAPLLMVQNSVGMLTPQVIGWPILIVISAATKYLVARHVGLSAVPFVGAIAHAVLFLPFAIVGYRAALREGVAKGLLKE